MTYEEILSHFTVKKRYQNKAQCICPAHSDKEASLTITRGTDSVLIHCHAGCKTEDVLQAAGLTMSDLFYKEQQSGSSCFSWKNYVEKKECRKIEAAYNYCSINGNYAYTKLRLQGKKMLYGMFDEKGLFRYGLRGRNRKSFAAIYGDIKNINESISSGKPIFIPEGEKDVDTLTKRGYVAFTYGGANDWNHNIAQLCKDADVYILADNDVPGKRVAETIQTDLTGIANSTKIIVPVPDVTKADISDYFEAGHSNEEFEELLKKESVVINKSESMQNLAQFHFINDKGNPTGVYDEAIFLYIKGKYDLFICGKTVYIYDGGCFLADASGARLKTIISRLIYPEFIKSTTLKRIYDRFLCDIDLEVSFDELNNYPSYFICFRNGMYDCKEKRLLPHSPKYKAINQIPHEYHAGEEYKGTCIEEYLNFICPDPDNREMLLEFVGYTLTKDVSQQKFLVLNGEGGSGKSTLIRLIEHLVGSRNISNISLMDLQERFASFGLMGKLLNSCADLEVAALEDTSVIKKILGEDTLRGEQKGRDAISFKNYSKQIFSTNELPVVKAEKTNGFYRRLLVLPMDRVPEKKNPNLLDELLQESDYFLQLSVKAVERMYERGTIVVSKTSENAVSQLRIDSDTVQAFLIDECILDEESRSERTALYNKYEKYCEESDRKNLTKNNFYKSLRIKGYKEIKTGGYRFFKGISVEKSANKLPLENAPDEFMKVPQQELYAIPFE